MSAAAKPSFAQGGLSSCEPTKAKWTIAIFMESDGGLAERMSEDLFEMASAPPPTADFNVTVQFFRSGVVERRFRNSRTMQSVSPVVRPVTQQELEELWPLWGSCRSDVENESPGRLWEPNGLSNFVKATAARFPAERYALIIGAHGDATRGLQADADVTVDGVRSLGSAKRPLLNRRFGEELRRAITGPVRLETIGLDVCLVASMETHYEVGWSAGAFPAPVVVSSQELEDGPGWLYSKMFEALFDKGAGPPDDGTELGARIIGHGHHAWNEWSGTRRSIATLSSVDSAVVKGPLSKALSTFGLELLDTTRIDPSVIDLIDRARCSCRRFPYGADKAETTDLGCFTSGLVTLGAPSKLADAAKSVTDALDAGVHASFCATRIGPDCPSGIGVYFPDRPATLSTAYSSRTGGGAEERPHFVVENPNDQVGGWTKWVTRWTAIPGRTTCRGATRGL